MAGYKTQGIVRNVHVRPCHLLGLHPCTHQAGSMWCVANSHALMVLSLLQYDQGL